jgi:transcriptional regulator with XRE-family HTH domain
MITGVQIRAARAALGWSIRKLADGANVGSRTLSALEETTGVPRSRPAVLQSIQMTLEDAGIEFIGAHNDAPGIRVHSLTE